MSALTELESWDEAKYRNSWDSTYVKMDSEKKESFGGEEEEVLILWWSK